MACEHRRTWQQKENLKKEVNLESQNQSLNQNLSQNQKGRKSPLVDMLLAFLEETKHWNKFSEKEKLLQVK